MPSAERVLAAGGAGGFGGRLLGKLAQKIQERRAQEAEQERAIQLLFAQEEAKAKFREPTESPEDKQRRELEKILATEKIKAQMKEQYPDTEETAKREIFNLSRRLQPTPTPGGSGFTTQERSLGIPEQVEEATRERNAPIQNRIDIFRTAISKPEKSFEQKYLETQKLAEARATGAAAAPRKLTATDATTLASAESAIKAIDELVAIEQGTPGSIRKGLLPATPPFGSEQTQEADRLIRRIQTEVTTARGGKQLTETEIKFIEQLLPNIFRKGTVNANALSDLREILTSVRQRIVSPVEVGGETMTSGMIPVRQRATGQTGQIPLEEFDPTLYERL